MTSGTGVRRASWYTGLVGLAVGAMLTGLLVPFIDGDRQSDTTAAADEFIDAGATPGGFTEAGSADPAAGTVDGSTDSSFVDGGEDSPSAVGVDGGTTSGGADVGSSSPTGSPASSGSASPRAGSSGGSSTPTTAGTSSSPSAPLRATDKGVTASTIKVAFLLLDLGQAGRIGVNTTGVNPKQQEQAFRAFVADLNGRGGINGRKVDPFFTVFDATNPDDQRQACVEATEDAKAFSVIAMPGYANAAVLCVTQEHKTPLVITGQGVSREFFRKSEGRLVTLAMSGDRMMRNLAAELDGRGVLKGKTVGIVSSDEPQYIETVEGILVPALRAAGHEVSHVSRLATWPRSQGQIPPEVQRMRASGADTVLFVGSFLNATTWVQTAEQQRWLPTYLVSEWAGMTSDFELQAMPQSFNGALAMTSQRFGEWRQNVAEPASAKRCIQLYEKATGERVPRNNGNESNAAYPVIIYACDMFRAFERAAKAAGPELTRSRWAAALPSSGTLDSGYYFPGAFRAGKTDMSDAVRFNRADMGCRCWRNADSVRPARFR